MTDEEILAEAARIRARHRKHVTGTCVLPGCGKTFYKYAGARYCSDRCRMAAHWPLRKERRKKTAQTT